MLIIKNPCGGSDLCIELSDEFTVYFGDWHGHYEQSAYEDMIEDLLAIIENRYCSVLFMQGGKPGCCGLLSEKITPQTPFESIVLKMVPDERNIPLFKSQYTAVNVEFREPEDCFKIEC